MSIESICSGCGQRLRVADEHRGKQARCPACGQIYLVGGSAQAGTFGDVDSAGSRGSGWAPTTYAPTSNKPDLFGPSFDEPSVPVASNQNADPPRQDTSHFAMTPDGIIYGPVDQPTLDRWIQEGRLNDSCRVRQGENGPWQPMMQWLAAKMPTSQVAYGGGQTPLASAAVHSEAVNPFSDAARPQSINPYHATGQYPYPTYPSDRSGVVLTMGILSWVLSCMYIGWIMAIIGIALAQQDFAAMRAGTLRPESRTMTQVGFWLCLVHLILCGIGIAFIILMFAIGIANG